MIFWLLLIAGIILCGGLAPTLGEAYLWYCIGTVPLSIGLTALASLLLGKPSQYKLTGFSNYHIRLNEDKTGFHVWETDEDFSLNEVDDIVYVKNPALFSHYRILLRSYRMERPMAVAYL